MALFTDPYGQIAHVGGYRGLLFGLPHYQVFHARSACKTLKLESLRLIVGFATSVMVVDWGLVSVQKRE